MIIIKNLFYFGTDVPWWENKESSISATFYEQLLYTNELFFISLRFCPEKNIGKKAARKMLVKLTQGFNFTNLLAQIKNVHSGDRSLEHSVSPTQHCAKLYQLTEIEFTVNFYVLHSKIIENQLA
jgi:hypothetical protein